MGRQDCNLVQEEHKDGQQVDVECGVCKYLPHTFKKSIGFVFMLEASIFFMLIHFEKLDIMQKLEREVNQLEQDTTEVEQKRREMRAFWDNAEKLTDLWIYRTGTCLDLYKVLHNLLADSPTDMFVTRLRCINIVLEEFDNTLGTLENWQENGTLTKTAKKQFAKEIADICELEVFADVVAKLEEFGQ